jgi:hypothetical protein
MSGVPANAGTKFGGGKARAGKNSFPPTPFLFARPSEFFSKVSVGIFAEKSSDFVQKSHPIRSTVPIWPNTIISPIPI